MRYNEIIESINDDDDDLFGRGLHHRIAEVLRAQAEEDQRIADEERALGDQIHRNVQNAQEFEEQARNYRYIADAFNHSMSTGAQVYRSLDRSWRAAVDDVVDMELDLDFREYVKQIPESQGDDELFGRTGGNFAGMSAQDIKDRWDELNDELYGYEAYWSDEDDEEFQQKENELKSLLKYARIRYGEAFYQYLSNWREHSDAQHARWQQRTRADPFSNRRYREDPRITKSGKVNKQDQKTLARDIKDRLSTHKQPVLPENTDDDDLFSTSDKLDRRHQLRAKTIRRIEKRDALNIQPGTRLMVKWDNGRYYKGTVARLTRGGRVVVQVKFHNVDWPLEKNISPRDIKPEHILSESADDDELFAPSTRERVVDFVAAEVKRLQQEKQAATDPDEVLWIGEELDQVRDIYLAMKRDFQAGADQLMSAANSHGWADGLIIDMQDAGIPFHNVYKAPWLQENDNDDDLFGQEDGARLALKLFKLLRGAVERDPRGVSDMLKQYNNENSTLEQRVQYTLDYMAQAVGMSREVFDHYSDDFYMMPWPKDVDWRRPWQVWDAQVLDKIIEIIQRVIYGKHMLESDDDELFGKSSELADTSKQKIKQIMDPYLRTIGKIRELAKTKYGAKIRVSGAPKKSARGRATVWVGDYDSNYQIPRTNPEAFELKKDLEQLGFECRFTDAGWLSVRVPPVFSNLISEDADDDELFGKTTLIDRIRDLLLHRQKVRVAVSGAMGWVRGMRDGDVIISRSPRSTTRYLWPGLHSERAKNFELAQDPATRVWVVTDRADID